jgi:hypothetical protein
MKARLAVANTLLAAGLSVGGVAGCSSHEAIKSESPADANLTVVSAPARTYVETEFQRYSDYLKNLGKIATNTRLVILSGGERFTCVASPEEPASTSSSWANSEYCASADTVVLTGGTINAAIHFRQEDAQISFTVGHELGHAEQNQKGELKSGMSTEQHAEIEEQATCFSGEEVRELDPTQIVSIESILSTTPMDSLHGSSAAQAAAFEQGTQGGPCLLENY